MQQPLLEPETIPGPYDTVDIEARRHGFPSCIDHSLHDQRISFRRRCCVIQTFFLNALKTGRGRQSASQRSRPADVIIRLSREVVMSGRG